MAHHLLIAFAFVSAITVWLCWVEVAFKISTRLLGNSGFPLFFFLSVITPALFIVWGCSK